MRKITVIGVPMWLGQTCFGTQLGPDAIRAAGLTQCLHSVSGDVIDIGNITISTEPCLSNNDSSCTIRNLELVRDGVMLLAEKVTEAVISNRFPLILGGDHSIAIGSLAGMVRHYQNLGVIWYDAHADSNTPETSPSGNIQGMPLAASMGMGHPYLVDIGGCSNKIKAENIVMIGVRDIDPGEKDFIQERQIKIFTSEDVNKLGIGVVMEEAISYLAKQCDGIHLSFDLDVIDPNDACGVGTPVDCGIDLKTNLEAMRILAQHKVITSAEFVELNPLLDKEGRSATAALALIQALLTSQQKYEIDI